MFIVTFCTSVLEVLATWPPVITFPMAATKSCQDSQSTVIESRSCVVESENAMSCTWGMYKLMSSLNRKKY